MKVLILFLSFLLPITGKGQCNVKTNRTDDGGTSKEVDYDKIYTNQSENNSGDSGKGVTIMNGFLVRFDSPGEDPDWGLQVSYYTTKGAVILPRRLVILFTNGATLTLDAKACNPRNQAYISVFLLTPKNVWELGHPIKSMAVIDYEKAAFFESNAHYGLYPNVFIDQLKCLQ